MTSTVPLREKCCEVSMNNPFLERKGMAPLKGMGQYFSLWGKKEEKKKEANKNNWHCGNKAERVCFLVCFLLLFLPVSFNALLMCIFCTLILFFVAQ